MNVKLLNITDDIEKKIERIGRICYKSENRITENSHIDFIKNLIKSGHESVLEHGNATFLIKEVSRSCTHQLVRHRLASYSQKSQRFVNENFFDYVIPDSILNNDDLYPEYCSIMNILNKFYNSLIEKGIKKEDARFVLPNACNTEIVMTANMREWRHILKLRLNKKAQWEIRGLCDNILNVFLKKCPVIFFDFV